MPSTDRDAIMRLLRDVPLNRDGPVALHFQLSQGIKRHVETNALKPGDCLPTVRDISAECSLSVSTVSRALTELKGEGVVLPQRGHGTYIAKVMAPTTELIGCNVEPLAPGVANEYIETLISHLQAAYGDERRRVVYSRFATELPSLREFIGICRLRHSDSAVVYRPTPGAHAILREVAQHVPSVSLFTPVPRSRVDCVAVDPAAALRATVQERLRAGRRVFVYVGTERLSSSDDGVESPYQTMRAVFEQTVAASGASLVRHVAPIGNDRWAEVRAAADMARALPPDAVLLASSPHLADELRGGLSPHDTICYTESAASADRFRDRMTLLYVDMRRVVAAAVELLKTADAQGRTGRIVRLAPDVRVPGRSGG